MSDSTDYFFSERYLGLADVERFPPPLDREVAEQLYALRNTSGHPESSLDSFSQELLFSIEPEMRDKYVEREVLFPYYRCSGDERFWRCLRTQAPYLERLAEHLPHLDLALLEQLWIERGRGMARAFPGPNDQKARWRSADQLTPGPLDLGMSPGPYAAIFVAPRWGVGGSEKVMRELVASFERLTGLSSLIIVADTAVDVKDLPSNVVCLSNTTFRGEPFLRNQIPLRVMALRDLILRIGASRVISINSFVGNALLQDGALQRDGIKTAAAMFCVAVGPGGAIEGYVQIVDWLLDAGVTLFTDNDHMARMIASMNFSDETVVLPAPERVRAAPPATGDNILWAGRIDGQKRPDLLLEIARLCPHRRFEVWGVPVLSDDAVMAEIIRQPNIDFRGGFDGFTSIDRRNVGCLLYTSAYDGTPNILLEAMACGLPCVCSGVGGIPDLMARGRGLVVPSDAPATAYVEALDSLMADAPRREEMVRKGRVHIRTAHSIEAFDAAVSRLLEAL